MPGNITRAETSSPATSASNADARANLGSRCGIAGTGLCLFPKKANDDFNDTGLARVVSVDRFARAAAAAASRGAVM